MNQLRNLLQNPQLQVRRIGGKRSAVNVRNKTPLIKARPHLFYANTMTNLIPILYEGLDQIARELVGMIGAVTRNSSAERAAKNQVINIPVVPALTASDITPGVTAPNDGDQTFGNLTMTISKSRYVPIRWNGEEQKQLGGTGLKQHVLVNQFTQAYRTLCNEVETDLAALYSSASRAYGTAALTPFATAADLSDVAQVLKILKDNGAPGSDLRLVLNTAAGASIRGKQSNLFRVNEAGTDGLLRDGAIGRLESFDVGESAKIANVVKGTGAGYTSTNAGFAIGTTVIPIITGAGTVLVGDVVTFAGDTNKYVVAVGVAAPGSITLAAPGLLQAIPAVATAMTIGGNYAANMAFSKSAIQLVTRAPAMPDGGDDADDVMEVTDPKSNLSFQVAVYRQYRQVRYEVGLAWGQKANKTEFIAILLG